MTDPNKALGAPVDLGLVVRVMSGEDLDRAVIEAAVGFAWPDDVPMPSESWADCGPLTERYGISFRKSEIDDIGPTQYLAQFSSGRHWCAARVAYAGKVCNSAFVDPSYFAAHGATAREAVCRALLLATVGEVWTPNDQAQAGPAAKPQARTMENSASPLCGPGILMLGLASSEGLGAGAEARCWCLTCRPIGSGWSGDMSDIRLVLCPGCGNKRCPKANDHRNACTESNATGQPGSAYQ